MKLQLQNFGLQILHELFEAFEFQIVGALFSEKVNLMEKFRLWIS